jgi:cob(I)alamin adenosyltransferase
MVHLTKIYTKTGDSGSTSIANNERVFKVSPIVEAIGAVDEANSAIGMITFNSDIIDSVQNDLFDLGSDLSGSMSLKITPEYITNLENIIDEINAHLQPLTSFVLPKGQIHNARAVTRRAERAVWKAIEASEDKKISLLIPMYLNRLSDLLFVLARLEKILVGEDLWTPGYRINRNRKTAEK